jgi:hypothetical protein
MMGYKRPAPESAAITPECPLEAFADEQWAVCVEGRPRALVVNGVATP